jgi:death-on-curing protein
MTGEPEWLTLDIVIDIHSEQLAIFGGPAGIRDQGMLESALGRPVNKFAYGETDLAALAAAYAYGIARNHPFVDGNKRAAFLALITFLGMNGVAFAPPQPAATAIILGLAAGEVSEESLARWIRDNWPASQRRVEVRRTTNTNSRA